MDSVLPTALFPLSSNKNTPETNLRWPQKRETIREAILSGERIDVSINETADGEYPDSYDCFQHAKNATGRCQAPPKKLATIVTCYYHIRSKHGFLEYKGWIVNMLQATDPMVIFVNPEGTPGQQLDWFRYVAQLRTHAPTIIVPLNMANLTTYTVFSDEFWENEAKPMDPDQALMKYLKTTDVYRVWNEKIIMTEEVARLNPFDTELIYWLDIGYFRGKRSALNYRPIIQNNLTANGLAQHQVLFHNVYSDPNKYEIAAGAWGGTPEAIHQVYERYWQTFWWMALHRYDCVGIEQRILVMMCKSFPDICHIQMDDKENQWVVMGRQWLQEPNRNWTAHQMQFLHNETQLVGPVEFPPEDVIVSVNRTGVSVMNKTFRGVWLDKKK